MSNENRLTFAATAHKNAGVMLGRPVAPLSYESLGEQAYRSVRDLILSQVFPPGSKLDVAQLCARADHVLEDAVEFTRRGAPPA